MTRIVKAAKQLLMILCRAGGVMAVKIVISTDMDKIFKQLEILKLRFGKLISLSLGFALISDEKAWEFAVFMEVQAINVSTPFYNYNAKQ